MAINIFTQFGVRAGGSVEYAYAFSTPTAYVNDNTCSPSGYTVCDEDNYVEGGNNTQKECRCIFSSYGNFTTRSSFTSNLPECGQGVVQSRALTRTRTGTTSSYSYSERTTYSGTYVISGWTCNTFTAPIETTTTTENVTTTSCVYTVTDEILDFGTCAGKNYDRGCFSSGTRSDCRSICTAVTPSNLALQIFSCTVQTTTGPVTTTTQSCGSETFTGSYQSSGNQTSTSGCNRTSCSPNDSCSGLSVSYQTFAFGACSGAFYSDPCNYAVCNNYSGTSCSFSAWSGWSEVSSCTSSTPGCSNGALQRECASETRTGQIQSRTSVCNRTEVS